ILSWANGWYFLIAVEIITLGPRNYRLPGMGSYLMTAAAVGKTGPLIAGLLTLVEVVVALDLLVWRPLMLWAERFKYDAGGAAHSLPAAARFRYAWGDWLDPAHLGPFRRPAEVVRAPADWVVRALVMLLSGVVGVVTRLVGSAAGKRLT